jgi:hypothetical protein
MGFLSEIVKISPWRLRNSALVDPPDGVVAIVWAFALQLVEPRIAKHPILLTN